MKKSLIVLGVVGTLVSSMAFAKSEQVTLPICGGSDGGAFIKLAAAVGEGIDKQARGETTAEVLETAGSLENIELIKSGDCAIAILQGDAGDMAIDQNILPPGMYAKRGYMEEVIWMANVANGFTDAEDVEGSKEALIVVKEGSGALATLRNWAREDSGYQVNLDNVIEAPSDWEAASIAADGRYTRNGKTYKVAGMLIVTRAAASESFAEIVNDFGGQLMLGSMTDGDFNDAVDIDGNAIYETVVLPTKKFKISQVDTFGGQKTLGVRTMVVYNSKWVDENVSDAKQARKIHGAVQKGIVKITKQLH